MRPGTATRHPSIIGDTGMEDFCVHALRPQEYIEDDVKAHSEKTYSQRGRPRYIAELPPVSDDAETIRFDMPVLRDNGVARLFVNMLLYAVENVRGFCFDSFAKWGRYNANVNHAATGLFFLLNPGGFTCAAYFMNCPEERLRQLVMQQFPEEKINELMRTKPFLALVAEQERVGG